MNDLKNIKTEIDNLSDDEAYEKLNEIAPALINLKEDDLPVGVEYWPDIGGKTSLWGIGRWRIQNDDLGIDVFKF